MKFIKTCLIAATALFLNNCGTTKYETCEAFDKDLSTTSLKSTIKKLQSANDTPIASEQDKIEALSKILNGPEGKALIGEKSKIQDMVDRLSKSVLKCSTDENFNIKTALPTDLHPDTQTELKTQLIAVKDKIILLEAAHQNK